MSGANLTQDTKSSELATSTLLYMSGFGNEFATEALPGALPVGQNNPQIVRIVPLSLGPFGRSYSPSCYLS